MILLRRGQDAAQAETWIRLENGALLHQSKNPRYAAGRQTVCEPGEAKLAACDAPILIQRSIRHGNTASCTCTMRQRGKMCIPPLPASLGCRS